MDQGRTVAILLAAGKGERAGGGVPKQFRVVAGRSLLGHALERLRAHPAIDAVVVIVGAGQQAAALEALAGMAAPRLIEGGARRRDSVAAALAALAGDPPTRVLVHDAARPFLPLAVIDRLLEALAGGAAGAIPVLPVVDTMVEAAGDRLGPVVPRDRLARVQTPQAFRFPALVAAHAAWPTDEDASDDAQMLRAIGESVLLIEGDPMLEKITHPADFALAEARRARPMRIAAGTGYDVHRLAAGVPLWLGGIEIPHDRGLAGHSDADVVIHALVDAILGALAEGDIGSHFPPSDLQWRGAASSAFLAFARDRVAARGGRIEHADLTIICEAPKIGPHRAAIRDRLAALMRLAPDQVSVKATTTERLGFTGRGEGIAAQAVVTLALPAANRD
jgi:2-C-methyl-D-erythritol 4-phosphate cytidylyltransferase/2-C-methyl-D-erythritol 2,4-cyclodiphosphate synthase